MDISSYTYECQYVHDDMTWITLNKTDQLGQLVLISVKDMVVEFIQSKESMDMSSSTYECQYVKVDIAWITLNETDHLGQFVLILCLGYDNGVYSIRQIHGHIVFHICVPICE